MPFEIPMITIPPNAKSIATVSNFEMASPVKQNANNAVVKMLELNITKNIPRGMNFYELIRNRYPAICAAFRKRTFHTMF